MKFKTLKMLSADYEDSTNVAIAAHAKGEAITCHVIVKHRKKTNSNNKIKTSAILRPKT